MIKIENRRQALMLSTNQPLVVKLRSGINLSEKEKTSRVREIGEAWLPMTNSMTFCSISVTMGQRVKWSDSFI